MAKTLPVVDQHLIHTAAGWIALWAHDVGKGKSHRFITDLLIHLFRTGRMTPRRLVELTHDPGAEIFADDACREIASGGSAPDAIIFYLATRPSKPDRGRGRLAADNYTRDLFVASTVALAREQWPFLNLRKNDATEKASVCSVLAAALKQQFGYKSMSEIRVWQIYEARKEFLSDAHQEWLALHERKKPAICI